MSAFTDAEKWAVWLGRGIDYVARAELPWEIGAKGSGLWFVVPVGTPFNTSVPKLLRWIFDPHDPRYLKAAALHDYALSLGWDRVSAAALFNDALRAMGVCGIERLTMTLGVTLYKWEWA